MPVLAKFYGIVIRMLGAPPAAPHFHAIYGDSELIVGVYPLRVLQGSAPLRVQTLVLEWATLHQQELLQAWQHVTRAQAPGPIAPLY